MSSDPALVTGFFYTWMTLVLIFNAFGMLVCIRTIIKHKGWRVVDRYLIWEYSLVLVMWILRFLSVIMMYRATYGVFSFLNIAMYLAFFTFEYLNLTKAIGLYRIINHLRLVSEMRAQKQYVSEHFVISINRKFDKSTYIIVIWSIIFTACFIVATIVPIVSLGCKYEPEGGNEYIIVISPNWKWYNDSMIMSQVIIPAIGYPIVIARFLMVLMLRSRMRAILRTNYNLIKQRIYLSFVATVLVIIIISFIVFYYRFTLISEIYDFGENYPCDVLWLVLATFVYTLPIIFPIMPIWLFSIQSLNYKKFVTNLLCGVQRVHLLHKLRSLFSIHLFNT